MTGANAELVEAGDLDELVRHVGRLARVGAWDELDDLRHRCRAAHERGRQLWPAASLAEYRMALDGPPGIVARVLDDDRAGAWALGPLPEVAASTHAFVDLAPHLTGGPARTAVARERAARGEDVGSVLRGLRGEGDDALVEATDGVPLNLQPWEPTYPAATYHPDRVEAPAPAVDAVWVPWDRRNRDLTRLPGDPGANALRELVAGWSSWTPAGACRVTTTAVSGDALAAIAAVAAAPTRIARVEPTDAMALMAWASASGGPFGRRRGLAAGRFDAWWALAALTGLDDDWPVDPTELGEAAGELEWWLFDDDGPSLGWRLQLAVGDPADGLAWAIDAAAVDASTLSGLSLEGTAIEAIVAPDDGVS